MTAWLLTWLWQGMTLAIGVSVAFRLLPRVNAATRYVIWWAALVALVWLGWEASPASVHPAVAAAGLDSATGPSIAFRVTPLPSSAVTLVLSLWGAVAFIGLLRIVPGLHGLYRLKHACRPLPSSVEEQLPLWQETRGAGRSVRLMLCDEAPNAAVLGFGRPYIVVPLLLLEGVSVEELDQIILHEYAHVQRRDDWMRLVQALVDVVLWMHPAAIWIGRAINLEREAACDDWVIARTGAARAYARCLARVAAGQWRSSTPVFFATFFGRRHDIFKRVDRLLDTDRHVRRDVSLAAASAGVCALAMMVVPLRAFPLLSESPRSSFVESAPSSAGSRLSDPPELLAAAEPGSSRIERATRPSAAVRPNDANFGATSSAAVRPNHASSGRTRTLVSPEPVRVVTEVAVSAEPAAVAPIELESLPLLVARSFPSLGVESGRCMLPCAAAAPETGWQRVGRAGVDVGDAARQASVGIAKTFMRAGVSLARQVSHP